MLLSLRAEAWAWALLEPASQPGRSQAPRPPQLLGARTRRPPLPDRRQHPQRRARPLDGPQARLARLPETFFGRPLRRLPAQAQNAPTAALQAVVAPSRLAAACPKRSIRPTPQHYCADR